MATTYGGSRPGYHGWWLTVNVCTTARPDVGLGGEVACRGTRGRPGRAGGPSSRTPGSAGSAARRPRRPSRTAAWRRRPRAAPGTAAEMRRSSWSWCARSARSWLPAHCCFAAGRSGHARSGGRASLGGASLGWTLAHGSRGRPSRRSAMTLRWISLVPPAIDRQRLPRKPPTQDAASPSAAAAAARAARGRPPAPAGRARRRAACGRWTRARVRRPPRARRVVRTPIAARAWLRATRPPSACRRSAPARRVGSADEGHERLDARAHRRAPAHRHPLVGERRAGGHPPTGRRADHDSRRARTRRSGTPR